VVLNVKKRDIKVVSSKSQCAKTACFVLEYKFVKSDKSNEYFTRIRFNIYDNRLAEFFLE
jgi:hypothetical protein